MTEMEALCARHSVRAYFDKPIEAETVGQLRAMIDEINHEGDLHIQFLENGGHAFDRTLNKVIGLASAPSVIACVGKDAPDLEERIGYYGQKLVLYAQALGLNTCWAGIFNKNTTEARVDQGERLVIVIAIGYGKVQGKPHKSKTPEQVSRVKGEKPEWFDRAVEAALLAPTAINQQKFEIFCDNGEMSFVDKGGPFSKVDLGIVKYCFELGKRK